MDGEHIPLVIVNERFVVVGMALWVFKSQEEESTTDNTTGKTWVGS